MDRILTIDGHEIRESVLHVGLHKTGTTSLQLAMRKLEDNGFFSDIRFSSQHAADAEWLDIRTNHWLHIRDSLIQERSMQQQHLDDHRAAIIDYFRRDPRHLLHSDENTMGFPLLRRVKRNPSFPVGFYPNGEVVIGEIGRLATHSGYRPHLIITLRSFPSLVRSSLSMAAREGRDLSNPDDLFESIEGIDKRLRKMIIYWLEGNRFSTIKLIDSNLGKSKFGNYLKEVINIPVPCFDHVTFENESKANSSRSVQDPLMIKYDNDLAPALLESWNAFVAWIEDFSSNYSTLVWIPAK